MMVFSGNANPRLAEKVVRHLNIPLGKALVGQFSDGEVQVEILENVRGKDVFIIQPTCRPTNDNLMELSIMCDALRRASAWRITTVIPYFGYSRQDRRVRSARVPISAKVVANMLTVAGANRILTVDLHADQVQGFFDVPVDNVYASPVLLGDIWRQKYDNLIVVSPDVGGVVRARALAKRLDDAELAIIDKRRPRANVSQVMHIIGDVVGKTCLIVDDMVDTAGTLCKAADALKEHGAERVVAYATHPVLSGPAIENISGSLLDELVVTDTIPLMPEAEACDKIRQLTVAGVLAETIHRINREESVSTLFMDYRVPHCGVRMEAGGSCRPPLAAPLVAGALRPQRCGL
jgi:ribose-phosphate pyrophosphokinase